MESSKRRCGGTAQPFSQGSHADSAIEFGAANFYFTGVGDLPPPRKPTTWRGEPPPLPRFRLTRRTSSPGGFFFVWSFFAQTLKGWLALAV
ncbi:MAG: hypothetical protein KL840_20705 [Aquamicrobium sp.]|nr:hypothetical protein [Aquamicrobium sp.]